MARNNRAHKFLELGSAKKYLRIIITVIIRILVRQRIIIIIYFYIFLNG